MPPIWIVRLSATVSLGGLEVFPRTFCEAGEEMNTMLGKAALNAELPPVYCSRDRKQSPCLLTGCRGQLLNVIDHRLALRLVAFGPSAGAEHRRS